MRGDSKMTLEDTMRSEISQSSRDRYCMALPRTVGLREVGSRQRLLGAGSRRTGAPLSYRCEGEF